MYNLSLLLTNTWISSGACSWFWATLVTTGAYWYLKTQEQDAGVKILSDALAKLSALSFTVDFANLHPQASVWPIGVAEIFLVGSLIEIVSNRKKFEAVMRKPGKQ